VRDIDGVFQALFRELGAMTAAKKLGVQMAEIPARIFLARP
jgi:hypothetical protein